jgi:hypothetical protein
MTMTTNIAVKDREAVARPLRILVPLIQADLQDGRDAAQRAGMPYYQAAGEKMLEARPQIPVGDFQSWVERNFNISYRQASNYMRLAQAHPSTGSALPVETLSEFIRHTNPNYNRPTPPLDWYGPVNKIVDRVDTETLNLKREELKRVEEHDAQRTLALQLIDIGYKVLARTLHPDKGGSRDAMTRLNAVRDRLKQHA